MPERKDSGREERHPQEERAVTEPGRGPRRSRRRTLKRSQTIRGSQDRYQLKTPGLREFFAHFAPAVTRELRVVKAPVERIPDEVTTRAGLGHQRFAARYPFLPGRGVTRWTRDFPAVFSRAPDRARPRALPRRHALRSPRPRRLSRGVSPTQGAVRGVGSRETGAETVSRRPGPRSRSRSRAPRADHAHPGRLVTGGARRRQDAAALRRESPRRARPGLATLVRPSHLRRERPRRCRDPAHRRRRLEPRLRGADGSGPRARRGGPCPRGRCCRAVTISRSAMREIWRAGWTRRSRSTSSAPCGSRVRAIASGRRRFLRRSPRRIASCWAPPRGSRAAPTAGSEASPSTRPDSVRSLRAGRGPYARSEASALRLA